jgi:hypothetical protein
MLFSKLVVEVGGGRDRITSYVRYWVLYGARTRVPGREATKLVVIVVAVGGRGLISLKVCYLA